MTPGLIKMWISFIAMGLLVVSAFSIMISRQKLQGVWRVLLASFAYVCMIVAGIVIVLIVLTGP